MTFDSPPLSLLVTYYYAGLGSTALEKAQLSTLISSVSGRNDSLCLMAPETSVHPGGKGFTQIKSWKRKKDWESDMSHPRTPRQFFLLGDFLF